MGNLTIATIFIVTLNVLMWFTSISMINMNPDGSMCFNVEGSLIGNSVTTDGNYSSLNNDVLSDLPSGQEGISSGTINLFTDTFNSVLSWLKSAPGLKYIYGVVSAPYNILKCLNLPHEFVIGIGTIWYLVSLLVLSAFILGRD